VRHELILVHSTRRRFVLLHAANAIPQTIIDQASALLRLPQVPAHELCRLGQPAPYASTLQAQPA
jgi:hypothetical protein